jgi:serine/threonine-protein kinase
VNGEVLAGRYRLLTLLGRGGAGEVWRAEDTILARQVAVKLLRSLDGDPMDSVERFRAEAQSAARLTHPNVVATYDVGTEGDHVFLVMELVPGPDLAQLMRTSGLPAAALVEDIATQGALALDAAHAAGIVHRDVKPGNLLLAPDGTLKMTDFGIAKRAGNETTGLGVLLGTASYVSPEQVRGEPATPASDWYAFGCVLHELLTGTPPFTGPTVDVVMRQHLDVPPPPITRTDVPAELANLVTHLLAKDPSARPSSAGEVAALLNTPANTQVLAMQPPAVQPGPVEPAGAGTAGAEPLGIGQWEDEPSSHRAAKRPFPLARVGIGAAVVLAAISGLLLLREGVSNDPPTAQAGGTPSVPVKKATTAPKTTTTPKPTPTPTATKTTPTKKPTTPKPTQNPRAVLVQRLRSLAAQVRATQQNSHSKAPRDAAHQLDQAAQSVDQGDLQSAAQHFYEARQRLAEAQQRHRWQATPQIATAFSTIAQSLPRPQHHDDE